MFRININDLWKNMIMLLIFQNILNTEMVKNLSNIKYSENYKRDNHRSELYNGQCWNNSVKSTTFLVKNMYAPHFLLNTMRKRFFPTLFPPTCDKITLHPDPNSA